jgi:hypothetical protein
MVVPYPWIPLMLLWHMAGTGLSGARHPPVVPPSHHIASHTSPYCVNPFCGGLSGVAVLKGSTSAVVELPVRWCIQWLWTRSTYPVTPDVHLRRARVYCACSTYPVAPDVYLRRAYVWPGYGSAYSGPVWHPLGSTPLEGSYPWIPLDMPGYPGEMTKIGLF